MEKKPYITFFMSENYTLLNVIFPAVIEIPVDFYLSASIILW